MIFRVARDVVTASYFVGQLNTSGGPPLTQIPVLEVNFLFVPGNSGGPIFDALTGRVLGFVQGYRSIRIEESVAQAAIPLPAGMGRDFIESTHAVYSIGVRIDRVQSYLVPFGAVI